jgi:hypothetical protein
MGLIVIVVADDVFCKIQAEVEFLNMTVEHNRVQIFYFDKEKE